VHHGSARHRPPHLSRHQRHQLLGRHRASPSDPPAPLRHLTPHPPFPATKSLPPPSHSPIPPTMAIASDSNAGAQPREDPSLLLITSFSLALSILTLATPTLGFVPLHHPPPHSDLYTRRLPPPSIMWPLPRRPTRLNSTTSSVISPLPSSRSGLSRSFHSGAPPPPPPPPRRPPPPGAAARWFGSAPTSASTTKPSTPQQGRCPPFSLSSSSARGTSTSPPWGSTERAHTAPSSFSTQSLTCGGDLVMRVGRPEVVIPELARAAGAEVVYAHGEVSRDEVRAEERGQKVVEKEGINVKYFWVARCTMWKTFPSALTTYRPTMVASGRP
jgi:hypothetical protein